jgi:hypothetical protein
MAVPKQRSITIANGDVRGGPEERHARNITRKI